MEQERMILSVEEAAAILGTSSALAYGLVRNVSCPGCASDRAWSCPVAHSRSTWPQPRQHLNARQVDDREDANPKIGGAESATMVVR